MAQWQRICLPVQAMCVQYLSREDHLEKETATHSSILAWEVPWTELVGYSLWCYKRVRHDLVTEQQQQPYVNTDANKYYSHKWL